MSNRYFAKIVFAMTFLFFGTVFSQVVHQVTAGDGTLASAITSAADGDIIELTSDGGAYTDAAEIDIDKSLIIRAHADLVTKPVISYSGADAPNYIFKVVGSARVELIGLDISGDGDAGVITNIIRLDNAGFGTADSTMEVFIENCDIHDSNQKLVRPYSSSNIDSMIITNSTFYNAGQEGVMLSSGGSSDPEVRLDYAEISNCTFYNIEREAIKGQTYVPTKVLVDHCTFYNIGGTAPGAEKPFIYIDAYLDVVVKNSIFHTNAEIGTFLRLESNDNVVNNIIFWNVNDPDIDNTDSVTDSLQADPLFTNPDNADFTLMEGSPALAFADDGNAAGDLRWDPNIGLPPVHKVEAGENTLYDAIQAAASGDIIELIDNGGVYLYTRETDKIEIDKVLTIRAKEGLNNRPIIRNDRPGGSSSMRNLEVLSGGGLTLIGLEFDGSLGDGIPAAKQAIRVNAGDSTNIPITIEDCYFHDYTENFLRGYLKTIIDTFIVKNTISTNALREGWNLYDTGGDGPAINYALFENVTITKTGREAIQFGSAALGYNPEVIINHCTMDSTSLDLGQVDEVIRFDGGSIDVTNATITNCIMSNQMSTEPESVTLFGTSTISYTDTFNVRPVKLEGTASIGDGMLDVDPMYNNPADLDYRLATGSAVRGQASDGMAMGDLRWEADPGNFYLTIETQGSGTVTLNPADGPYEPGTAVSMTAVPALGWGFSMWQGNVFPPNANPVNITMNKDETVKAIFKSLTPQVTLEIDTIGLGGVLADPEPVDGTYDEGTNITLTAVPVENWEFVEWLGDVTGTDNPVTFAADSNMNVTASFQSTLTQFELVINVVGKGSVDQNPEPVIATYDTAAVVELSATPALGWDFVNWSGDLESDMNPVNVKMDSNITINAIFMETQYASHSFEVDTSWNLLDAVQIAINNSIIDTLVLVTDGGVYLINDEIELDSTDLVVRGKDDLAKRPIIKYIGDGTSAAVFRIVGSPRVAIENLEIDGDGTGEGAAARAKYFVRLDNGDTAGTAKVFVNNCIAHDLPEKFIKPYSFCGIDSLVVHNSTFYDGDKEGIALFQGSSGDPAAHLRYVEIVNCTFYSLTREGIKGDTNPNTVVRIDHCTFYDCGGPDKPFIYIDDMLDVVVKNSIFQKNLEEGNFLRFESDDNIVSNIIFWDLNDYTIDNTTSISDTLRADPMFAEPENGDFTLMEGSPAYGFADDGKAAGDLQWAVVVDALVDGEELIPSKFYMKQNYPNPFNPSTTIAFGLNKPGKTKLIVYNVLGREIATLINKDLAAGTYNVQFHNDNLASGIYFYRLVSGKNVSVKKMLFVK